MPKIKTSMKEIVKESKEALHKKKFDEINPNVIEAYNSIYTIPTLMHNVRATMVEDKLNFKVYNSNNEVELRSNDNFIKQIIAKSTLKKQTVDQIREQELKGIKVKRDGIITDEFLAEQTVNGILEQVPPNKTSLKQAVVLKDMYRAFLDGDSPIQNPYNTGLLNQALQDTIRYGVNHNGDLIFEGASLYSNGWDDNVGETQASLMFPTQTVEKAKVNDIMSVGLRVSDGLYGNTAFQVFMLTEVLLCTNLQKRTNLDSIVRIDHQTQSSFAQNLAKNLLFKYKNKRMDYFDTPYNEEADKDIIKNLTRGYLLESHPQLYKGIEDRYYAIAAETILSVAAEKKDDILDQHNKAAEIHVPDVQRFFKNLIANTNTNLRTAGITARHLEVFDMVMTDDETVYTKLNSNTKKYESTLLDVVNIMTRTANSSKVTDKISNQLQILAPQLIAKPEIAMELIVG